MSKGAYTQVPSLWFADGDIIIHCGQKEYRIHQFTLTSQCTVFEDMTLIAQELNGQNQEPQELELQDDSEELTTFLRGLHEPSYFPSPPEKVPFITLKNIFRLSHKYDCQILRKRALQHISSICPINQDHFFTIITDENVSVKAFFEDSSNELVLLSLCREAEIHWALPSIFYRGDLQTILECMHKHVSNVAEIAQVLKPGVACSSQKKCLSARVRSSNNLLQRFEDQTDRHFLFAAQPENFSASLCGTCRSKDVNVMSDITRRNWAKLPSLYNIPYSWKDLATQRSKDL
ncbi:hypothetical protein DL96DRAFT_1819667 [Flagelloscypha sp. PMI_526]|nr:hypothetical protein DL96DRAFT_1819667 [Flagelloscypha sp. PMI_526]